MDAYNTSGNSPPVQGHAIDAFDTSGNSPPLCLGATTPGLFSVHYPTSQPLQALISLRLHLHAGTSQRPATPHSAPCGSPWWWRKSTCILTLYNTPRFNDRDGLYYPTASTEKRQQGHASTSTYWLNATSIRPCPAPGRGGLYEHIVICLYANIGIFWVKKIASPRPGFDPTPSPPPGPGEGTEKSYPKREPVSAPYRFLIFGFGRCPRHRGPPRKMLTEDHPRSTIA